MSCRNRNIFRNVFAVAGLLVECRACFRVRFRDSREIHHICRACQSDIGTACGLQREVEDVFAVLRIQSNLSFRVQFCVLACIRFRVFGEVRHCERKTAATARESDCCAAVSTLELRRIFRCEENPICIFRAICHELSVISRIGFCRRIEDIHANGTIDGRGPCNTACDGRIGDVRCMICRDANRLPRDFRAVIDMRLRIGMEGYGRIRKADACRLTAAKTASPSVLCEGGHHFYIRRP